MCDSNDTYYNPYRHIYLSDSASTFGMELLNYPYINNPLNWKSTPPHPNNRLIETNYQKAIQLHYLVKQPLLRFQLLRSKNSLV